MVRIRKMKPKDIVQAARIMMREFSKPPYKEKWSTRGARKRIKEILESRRGFCIVAEEKREVTGYAICSGFTWFDGERGLVEDIAVKEGFQGKGIGTGLVKQIERHYAKKGAAIII